MTAPAADTRLLTVDIMRGIAALMVVVYHARAEYWIGFRGSWAEHGLTADPGVLAGYATLPFSLGWFGVQIFFVLSGYCIHRRYAFELQQSAAMSVDWRRFFIRRFFRIYPVYIAALICTALVDYLYVQQGGTISVGELSWSAFFASVFTVQGLAAPMFGSNTVFWTLSIEMHLYLFYPLLFAINQRRGATNALACAFAVSALYVAAYLLFDLGQFFPHAHGGGPIFLPFVFMWAAGAFLADVEAGRARKLAGPMWHITWIASLVGGFALHLITDEVVSALPLAIGAAGLVQVANRIDLARLRVPALVLTAMGGLGAVSYSLYATHRVAFGMVNAAGLDGQSAWIVKMLLATAFAILVARLFYVLVEKASLDISSKFRGARLQAGQPTKDLG